VRLDNGNFVLTVYLAHLVADPVTVFCFRVRTVASSINNFCNLDGLLNSYTCLEVVSTTTSGAVSGITVSSYISDYNLNTQPASTTPLPSSTISIGTSQVSTIIDSFVTNNTIYEVYAGYQRDPRNDPLSKNAFFHTFRLPAQQTSDDLMMQRHPHCFEFYHGQLINFNLVFYGGVIRGGNETMFVHVLSYITDISGVIIDTTVNTTINLNGYIGFSFSKSHAERDMIGFVMANSTIFDMYSLYYSTPYLDESPNVLGTTDIQSIADSASYISGNNTHYFSGGIIRLYDTMDNNGDEIIRKKMNNTYCISVGYSGLNNSYPYSPVDPNNIHNDYGCFTSTVELWEPALLLSLAALAFLIL
jgi:hypothetical protein